MLSLKVSFFFSFFPPGFVHVMLSTLLFFMNWLRNQLKPFKSRDQARRTNVRWQVFKYICREILYPGAKEITLALLMLALFSYMIKTMYMFWEANKIVILYRKVYSHLIVSMAYINN